MGKKKILVVDDSKVVLLTQEMFLKKLGKYELITAANGQEAVDLAAAELPDLILMDVVMPQMNGFEATKEIRRKKETCHIPIVLVTTRGESDNVKLGYEAGCSDYITKPIDRDVLVDKIESLIE